MTPPEPNIGPLAEALHDLKAALRSGGESSDVCDVLISLAHSVRELDGHSSGSHIRMCCRLQLLPLLLASVQKFGLASYEAKLALCIVANFTEAGGGQAVRECGGLELITLGISASDADVRYLAISALRNQLAADPKSHELVLGTKTEALLTMLISSAVDARTLDSATSALNNLHGFNGERARAMGAPLPLPASVADALARHAQRKLRLEERPFGGYVSRLKRPPASGSDPRTGPAGGAGAEEEGGQQRMLAEFLTPGPALAGAGTRRNSGLPVGLFKDPLGQALGRAFGVLSSGGSPGPGSGAAQVDEAKTRLLLKANIRRRFMIEVWAAELMQAAARGRAARLRFSERLAAHGQAQERELAALRVQGQARALASARREISAARLREQARLRAEEAQRARSKRAGAHAQQWVLRVQQAALASAVARAREIRDKDPCVRATHQTQLQRLAELSKAKKLSGVESDKMRNGLSAAYAAFEMELPAAEQRVAKWERLVLNARARIDAVPAE